MRWNAVLGHISSSSIRLAKFQGHGNENKQSGSGYTTTTPTPSSTIPPAWMFQQQDRRLNVEGKKRRRGMLICRSALLDETLE